MKTRGGFEVRAFPDLTCIRYGLVEQTKRSGAALDRSVPKCQKTILI